MKKILLLSAISALVCGPVCQIANTKFHSTTSTNIKPKGNEGSNQLGGIDPQYFTRGGFNSFKYYFSTIGTTKVVNFSLKIANALIQYYYPELAGAYYGLYDLLDAGQAFTGGALTWSPYTALQNVFTSDSVHGTFLVYLEDLLKNNWNNIVYPEINDAYLDGDGLSVTLTVNPEDGQILGGQGAKTDILHIGAIIKPSDNYKYGNLEYPGSQLKIRVSEIYSQIIAGATKLHNAAEFWDWLTAQNGQQYPPDIFPLGKSILGDLDAGNGQKITPSGGTAPWFIGSVGHHDVVQEMRSAVISNISKILAMAKQQEFNDGFVMTFTRLLNGPGTISTVSLTVAKPLAVHTPSTYQGVSSDKICKFTVGSENWIKLNANFNNTDELAILSIDTPNHFYNWLTAYEGVGWHWGQGVRTQFKSFGDGNGLDFLQKSIDAQWPYQPANKFNFSNFKSGIITSLRRGQGETLSIGIGAYSALFHDITVVFGPTE